jgi:hypothetical protein
MPIAWYLCPYNARTTRRTNDSRYCAMQDFDAQIVADGGAWVETEVLGNHALVKVRAASSTLTTINAAAGFTRLPKDALNMPLSDLANPQKAALRDKALALGYTMDEITARFGNDLGAYTLGDVARFIATRRITARYDAALQNFVFDGAQVTPRSVDEVDGTIG